MKSIVLRIVLVFGVSASYTTAAGDICDASTRLRTDADIVTAIDDSSSMTRLDRVLVYTGLSKAVMDPRFLARIATGPNARVGFTAFTWSSDGKVDVIVPWMIIATANDAEAASARFLKTIETDPWKQFVVRRT